MQTQPQLLMLQKTMVVVEGVARKLNPNTNIWTTSKPVLESWLKETKDPMTTINETIQNGTVVILHFEAFILGCGPNNSWNHDCPNSELYYQFTVSNAFTMDLPSDSAVCLPYVLDAFEAQGTNNLMCLLGLAMAPGQELIVMVTQRKDEEIPLRLCVSARHPTHSKSRYARVTISM